MLPRFGKSFQLLAYVSQIVVRIGIARIKTDCLPEVLSCRFKLADFFQDAPQIEVGKSVFGVQCKSAPKVLGGLFEISIFVVECAAIDQGIELSWIGA